MLTMPTMLTQAVASDLTGRRRDHPDAIEDHFRLITLRTRALVPMRDYWPTGGVTSKAKRKRGRSSGDDRPHR